VSTFKTKVVDGNGATSVLLIWASEKVKLTQVQTRSYNVGNRKDRYALSLEGIESIWPSALTCSFSMLF